MAKARSRTATRKIKDKWKAKSWYNILAPASFENVTVADTLSDNPTKLINRVTEVSLQDLTNDFRKSHIKLYFKIYKIEESNALTHYIGHTLTSDYLRRMIRRKRSKIDGIYDVNTKDGAIVRVKPFATTDKRIQNSQRKIVRETMNKTISDQAKNSSLSEFIKNVIDGKTGSDIFKKCKKLYPVKRVEIHKTEVLSFPTIEIKEEKKTKSDEEEVKESDKKEKKKPEKKSGKKVEKSSKEVKKDSEETEIKKEEKKVEKSSKEVKKDSEETEIKKEEKKVEKSSKEVKKDSEETEIKKEEKKVEKSSKEVKKDSEETEIKKEDVK